MNFPFGVFYLKSCKKLTLVYILWNLHLSLNVELTYKFFNIHRGLCHCVRIGALYPFVRISGEWLCQDICSVSLHHDMCSVSLYQDMCSLSLCQDIAVCHCVRIYAVWHGVRICVVCHFIRINAVCKCIRICAVGHCVRIFVVFFSVKVCAVCTESGYVQCDRIGVVTPPTPARTKQLYSDDWLSLVLHTVNCVLNTLHSTPDTGHFTRYMNNFNNLQL